MFVSRNRLLALALVAGAAMAQTPEEQGRAIAVETDRRDTGFGDFTAEMVMTLHNRHGEESVRAMYTRVLEGATAGDGDKSLISFDEPADVKGTSLLTYTHKQGPDDQWLYLPALKRVKRIASSNKSGPFMGSEFAYEDLNSQEIEKYSHRFLRDDVLDGRPVFVVERDPVDENSGYTREVVFIDKEHYRPAKVDYYDRKNAHLKTLIFSEYQQYLGQYWRAGVMDMSNHQTGKRTILRWNDYRFGHGFNENDFSQNSLKRAR
ncbi:MAG: outer membrane lipoprotein-sorting protein [Chromatiales bacterium]|nr:outer membrane lipoprotein-sorting protein [Chromatiales bacterium]